MKTYVVYEAATGKLVSRKEYKTPAAAKAALTRYLKRNFPESDIVACNLADAYAIGECLEDVI